MNLEFVFKIIEKEEWQIAKQTGTYNGSDNDKKDGYIHFSRKIRYQKLSKSITQIKKTLFY